MPISAIPVGGDQDFYMLSEHEDYELSFKAWGYFNLEDPDAKLVKVLACSHQCEHHPRTAYVDYVEPLREARTPTDPPF